MTRTPRHARAGAAALGLALVLTGCAGAADEPAEVAPPSVTAPAPEVGASEQDEPARPPSRSLPEVQVQRADLSSQQAPEVVPPTGVSIPAIDVVLPVEPVGVEDDGQMEIPPLAEVGGWYRYGASPAADSGTAVIAAHVDSVASAGVGPFARLRDLAQGDVVGVDLADGTTREYVVTSVVRTPKPEVTWDDVFVRDGGHRLVLITCGGSFQREVRSYSDNVIVTAEPRV